MNPKTTGWLVISAMALAAFILFFEREWRPDRKAAPPETLFPGLVPENVMEVQLLRSVSNAVPVTVTRSRTGWQLTSPVAYPAHDVGIEAFVEACAAARIQGHITPADLKSQPDGLKNYGLAPAQLVVRLKTREEELTLRIGNTTEIGDRLYVQANGDPDVHLIQQELITRLPVSAAQWRERALLSFNQAKVNRLEIRAGSRGFEVAQTGTNADWMLTKPPPAKRADNHRIDFILREIQDWKVGAFVSDDPNADLESLGLATPTAELILGNGTNNLVTVQFGGSPTNAPNLVYARRLAHTNIVVVARNWLDALTQPFNTFRDRQLFHVQPESVQSIQVTGPTGFALARQGTNQWAFTRPADMSLADPELVKDFLRHFLNLEVVSDGFVEDVVTDFAKHGLEKPSWDFSLFGADTNAPLARLGLGPAYQADKVVVRRYGENAVYALARGDVQELPSAPLFLRDRQIWNFSGTNVTAFEIRQHGQTRRLIRTADGKLSFAPGSEGIINPLAFQDALNNLCHLRAVAWVGNDPKRLPAYGVDKDSHTLILEVPGPEDKPVVRTLRFGRFSPNKRPYAATEVDNRMVLFEFPIDIYVEVIREMMIKPKDP